MAYPSGRRPHYHRSAARSLLQDHRGRRRLRSGGDAQPHAIRARHGRHPAFRPPQGYLEAHGLESEHRLQNTGDTKWRHAGRGRLRVGACAATIPEEFQAVAGAR
ncbi:hypothetical protein BC938DRAFT_476534 [Jimgerdemannia flammicorona]|uniref:Uncharacterized protein n=1 Tax=Jimgerdemannia flammicorona TaxID=994334 RepID=A0A433QQG4_9FUNG|nr:hypothetical protein BC938DRAFT_476534 [Jimgerdemannia flammicorona]